MADRRVKVIFEAEIAKFKAGMDELSKSSKDAAKEAETTGKAVNKKAEAIRELGPVAATAGAGIVAGVGLSIKKFADFDKAMSSVQAATHETTGNMTLLREAAMKAGADTAFSAEEAAKGIEELAKAGVSTADIMGGGLDGALSLAAAGELAVGDAAEIAATAMTQFKLSGDQIPHLADLLAAGAGKAQGSVSDLGAALNQSGLVASAAGLNIEETTGTLAAFASSGLIGSDAGTSFKSMLQALQNPSKKAALEMERLGISLYDSNGEFAGMDVLAGQLKSSLEGATSAERDQTMAVIFGSDAVRAANVLYSQGADGINDWTNKVNDAGYAAETAAIMQNNLTGDLELLGGAFDTVFLKAGGTGNDALRGFVQGAESLVDMVGKIPAPIMGVGTILAGVAGGALLLGGGLITAIPKIKDTVDALRDVAPAGGKADKALRGVGKGAAYAAGAIGALSIVGPTVASWVGSGIKANPTELSDSLFKIGEGGAAAGAGLSDLEGMFTGKGNFMDGLDVQGLDDAFRVIGNPDVSDNVDNTLSSILSFGTRGSSNIEFAKKNFMGLDQTLADMVANGSTEEAAKAYEELAAKAQASGVPIEKLVEIFPGYNSSLAANATEASSAAASEVVLKEALDEVGVSAEGVVEDMEKFLEQLFAAGVVTRDERGALREYEASIDAISESIKENGKSLDETTEKGRANQEAYDGIAASGQAYVEALAAGGASEKDLQAAMSGTYESLIVAAGQFGISGDKADAMARKVMGIPDDVSVSSWMSEQAKNTAEATKGAIDAIPKSTTIYTHYKTTGSKPGPIRMTPKDVISNSFLPQKAGGGEIEGSGIKGVDSELILAAPGEHMLTAREVDLMGGQDAVYRFRSELKQGVPAYAGGGAIGVMSGGFSSGGSSGAPSRSVSIKVDVHGATDGPAVARQVLNEIGWKLNEQGLGVNL